MAEKAFEGAFELQIQTKRLTGHECNTPVFNTFNELNYGAFTF